MKVARPRATERDGSSALFAAKDQGEEAMCVPSGSSYFGKLREATSLSMDQCLRFPGDGDTSRVCARALYK